MYLMKVSVNGYSAEAKETLKATTLDQWQAVAACTVCGDKAQNMAEDLHKRATADDGWFSFESIVTVDCLALLSDMGLAVEVRRVKGLLSEAHTGNIDAILQEAKAARSEVHIHVPGALSLLDIRCVKYLEDACTNELQSHLDKGWVIIAVCPANDTRRPTYIIGHKESQP